MEEEFKIKFLARITKDKKGSGYGYLTNSKYNKDIFVHASDFDGVFDDLIVGDVLTADIILNKYKGEDKLRAINVKKKI